MLQFKDVTSNCYALRAYDLAGFAYPDVVFIRCANAQATVRTRNSILLEILAAFPDRFVPFRLPGASRRSSLLMDGKFKLYVWIAHHRENGRGGCAWRLRPPSHESDGLTLLCTLQPGNQEYQGLYLFPALDLGCSQRTLRHDDKLLQAGLRLSSLSHLCTAARKLLVANAIPVPKLDISDLHESNLR